MVVTANAGSRSRLLRIPTKSPEISTPFAPRATGPHLCPAPDCPLCPSVIRSLRQTGSCITSVVWSGHSSRDRRVNARSIFRCWPPPYGIAPNHHLTWRLIYTNGTVWAKKWSPVAVDLSNTRCCSGGFDKKIGLSLRGFQWLGASVFSTELRPACRDTCLAEFKTGEPGPELLKTAVGVILSLTAAVAIIHWPCSSRKTFPPVSRRFSAVSVRSGM
jgi:hypothetical protein